MLATLVRACEEGRRACDSLWRCSSRLFLYPAVNHAGGGAPKEKPTKLDKVLRKAADAGDKSAQRVIVRTRKGHTSAVADRLKKHGDRVESEHRRLNSFTATVHGDDLRALEADPDIEGLSVDAIIAADGVAPDTGQSERSRRQPADIGARSY